MVSLPVSESTSSEQKTHNLPNLIFGWFLHYKPSVVQGFPLQLEHQDILPSHTIVLQKIIEIKLTSNHKGK